MVALATMTLEIAPFITIQNGTAVSAAHSTKPTR